MSKTLHPHLIEALQTIVSFSKENEKKYFRIGVKKIIENHISWMVNWLETNQRIFSKFDKATADSHEDDIAMCLFAIDEWENEDRSVGMRYNALSLKFQKLMTVEKRQIIKEELALQKEKIEELVKKANTLAQDWYSKLKNHTYNPKVSSSLKWLLSVTAEELISNYERWEKEKL